MAITVGDAVVKFIGDRSGLNKDFDKAHKQTKSFAKKATGGVSKAFSGMFSVMGGVLAAGVVSKVGSAVTGMFKDAISYGSDAEEMLGKFGVTFGESGDALTKRLTEFGGEAGRSRYELQGMAADFGAVLKGMNLSSDMAAQYSGDLAELAVDVGSFMNAQSPEVMDKFRAAMTGEYESLKSLGIVINQASVDQELLNMGIEGGAKAATEAELVQARYNLLIQKTGDAQGDAIRTSSSWANTSVKLNGIWKDFMTDVGRGTTTALSPLLKTAADIAGNVLPKLAQTITDKVMPAITEFVDKILLLARILPQIPAKLAPLKTALGFLFKGDPSVMLEGIAFSITNLGELFGMSADAADDLAFTLTEPLAKAMDALSGIDTAGASSFLMDMLGLSPEMQTQITTQVTGIIDTVKGIFSSLMSGDLAGAMGGLFDLAGLFTGLKEQVRTAMFDIGRNALDALGNAFPGLKPLIDGVFKPLLDIGQTVMGALTGLKSTVTSTIVGMFTEIGPKLLPLGGGIVDTLTSAMSGITSIVESILGDVLPFITDFAADAASFLMDEFGGIIDWFTENMPLIQATVETVLGAIQVVWDTVWPYLAQVLEGIWENIKMVIDTAINAALGIIKTVMLLIQGDWEGAWEEIKGVGERIFGMILDVLGNTLDTILGLFGSSLEELTGFIEGKLASAFSTVEGWINKVKDAFGTLGGAISKVLDWFKGLGDKLAALPGKIPDWLIPGSPTPLELAMDSLGPAIGRVADYMATLAVSLGKYGAEAAEDFASAMLMVVDAMGQVAQISTDFGSVGGQNVADYLDWFVATMISALDRVQHLHNLFGSKRIKTLQKDAERFRRILDAVLVDLSAMVDFVIPPVDLWFDALEQTIRRAIDLLMRIAQDVQAEFLDGAATLADGLTGALSVLGIALDFVLPESKTFLTDVVLFGDLLLGAARSLAKALTQLAEEWADSEMFAALVAPQVQAVVGVLSSALGIVLPEDPKAWAVNLYNYGRMLVEAAQSLASQLILLGLEWADAEMFAALVAPQVQAVVGMLTIDLPELVSREDYAAQIDAFVGNLLYAGLALAEALPSIVDAFRAVRDGIETNILPEVVEAAAGLTEVFGILGLVSMFRDLQVLPKVSEGEYRTALSNVITGFIIELKNATPILKAGLQEVEAMWGSLLDSFLGEEGIIAKIKELFEGLGSAIQNAADITGAEFSVDVVLSNVNKLYEALAALANMPVPTMPAIPAPTTGGSTATATGQTESLGETLRDAVAEGMQMGTGTIEVRFSDDFRAFVTQRLDRLDLQVRNMSGMLESTRAA